MEREKRKAGRPKGTGIDDSVPLMAIARLMIKEPAPRLTTAMRAVYRGQAQWPATIETLMHRWREKWATKGDDFVAAARAEKAEAERQRTEMERRRQTSPDLRSSLGYLNPANRPAQFRWAVPPELRTAVDVVKADQTMWSRHRDALKHAVDMQIRHDSMRHHIEEIAKRSDAMHHFSARVPLEAFGFGRMARLAETVARVESIDRVVRQVEAFIPPLPKLTNDL